jgi:phosphoglycolate phosphatase
MRPERSMQSDFRLLVFDWDGTLMDSAARITACMQSAMRDVGMPPIEESRVRDIIGLGLAEALEALVPGTTEELRSVLVERYRYHFLIADPTPSVLFEGAEQCLYELRAQGYLLAVATGKSRRGLDKSLAETGLGELFHVTRCADETASKPDPRMLLEIMEDLHMPREHTLMIGDTEYDLMMARNAGVQSLAVGYGVHERGRLLRCAPLGCLESIAELTPWLRSVTGASAQPLSNR